MLRPLAEAVDHRYDQGKGATAAVDGLVAALQQQRLEQQQLLRRTGATIRRLLSATVALSRRALSTMGRSGQAELGEERLLRLEANRLQRADVEADAQTRRRRLVAGRLGLTHGAALENQWHWTWRLATDLEAAWQTIGGDEGVELLEELVRDSHLLLRRVPGLITRSRQQLEADIPAAGGLLLRGRQAAELPGLVQQLRALGRLGIPEPHIIAQLRGDLARLRLRPGLMPGRQERQRQVSADDPGDTRDDGDGLSLEGGRWQRLPDGALRPFDERQRAAIRAYFTSLAEERWP